MTTLKLYSQLVDELSDEILEGRLPGGTALPTQREFARQRGIGLSTVTRVYAELQRRGLVVGEVGRGTFVRERPLEPLPLAAAIRYTALPRTAESIGAATLRQALRRAASLPDIERMAAQPTPLGSPATRLALARHLARLGFDIDAARIVTTGGGLAAMRLAVLATLERGQRVAADAVTYPGWRLVSEQLGLELLPMAIDHHGPVPESLERLLRRCRVSALHCMPTAQHPLGWVMPSQRLREIVALAREHDLTLFEDATYNHLVRGSRPSLTELAPERTWLMGSLSGVLGDGLRLGYLVAPRSPGARLERMALSWGLTALPLVAELARGWLEDRTVESLQIAQRQHADQLWSTLGRSGLRAHSPSTSGWLFWLPLPRGRRAETVALALRAQGIDAVTSDAFALTPHRPNAIAIRMRAITASELREKLPAITAACGLDTPR